MSITFTTLAGRYTVADGQVEAAPPEIWPGVDEAWSLVALDGQIWTPAMGVYEQADLAADEGAVVTLVRCWVTRSGDWIVDEDGEYPEMRGETVNVGAPTTESFHLQGQHDQQDHAGGRRKAAKTSRVPEGATVVEDDAWAEREGNERLSGEGDCYPTANRLVMSKMGTPEEDNWRVVHGVVTGQGELEGIRFGHAWAEETIKFPLPDNLPDDVRAQFENATFTTVHDQSNGNNVALPAELYYKVGQIDRSTVQTYTPEEAALNMARSGHHGPWEDDE